MLRKATALFLSVLMVLVLLPVGLFASNIQQEDILSTTLTSGVEIELMPTDCENAAIIERDRQLALCPINNANIAAREAEFQEFLSENNVSPRSRYFNTINVPVFEQERSYWCGPATARQVIHFRNGSAPTQAVLARELGTTSSGSDVHDVGRIVNNHTGFGYAHRHMSHDMNAWVDQVRFSVDRMRPAIITIRTIGIPAFPYQVAGHIVNVSGYDLVQTSPWSDDLQPMSVYDMQPSNSWTWTGSIRITDPFGPGLGNRWYAFSTLFHAHVTNRAGTGPGQGAHFMGRASW
ncbi:MAG: C39 family peptidase [Defluviitaleaceae bacterium]|nr:C39 family peptidase [Defluviitaleaceae bacterium]